MHSKRRRGRFPVRMLMVTSVLMVALLSSGTASAHPLGNFTINRYSRLTQANEQFEIVYVLDMAEIPAHAERWAIDADGDGVLSPQELAAYRNAKATELLSHLVVSFDGIPATLAASRVDLEFPEGQAGLPTLRLRLEASAVAPSGSFLLAYQDDNYAERLGWSEVVVRSGRGWGIESSTAPTTDVSNELTAYPEDLLNQPPAVRGATARFSPTVGAAVNRVAAEGNAVPARGASPLGRTVDPFADLVAIPDLQFLTVLAALFAAVGWGAMHALSPGHGKTIVAAYLVGARGTAWHALFLGLTTTITHTAGVFLLGAATLLLSRYIVPEQLFPWISAISGLLVILVGLSLVRNRLHPRRGASHSHAGHAHADDHDHLHDPHHDTDSAHVHDHPGIGSHAHGHAHHHDHDPDHDHGHTHSHLPLDANGRALSWRGLLALGVTGGLLPCPSALVLMLGAISLNRVGFGLLLILAFSAGLAGVLTLIGLVLLHARWFFERLPERGRLLRWAPVASAIFIVAAGLVITVQALAQTGFLFG